MRLASLTPNAQGFAATVRVLPALFGAARACTPDLADALTRVLQATVNVTLEPDAPPATHLPASTAPAAALPPGSTQSAANSAAPHTPASHAPSAHAADAHAVAPTPTPTPTPAANPGPPAVPITEHPLVRTATELLGAKLLTVHARKPAAAPASTTTPATTPAPAPRAESHAAAH